MAPRKKPPAQDIKRLQAVASKMLARLEQELDQEPPKSKVEVEARQKIHEWLFGSKTPPMEALATLADLMLKLAQTEGNEREETQDTPDLTAADITLIEEFVRKTRPR